MLSHKITEKPIRHNICDEEQLCESVKLPKNSLNVLNILFRVINLIVPSLSCQIFLLQVRNFGILSFKTKQIKAKQNKNKKALNLLLSVQSH